MRIACNQCRAQYELPWEKLNGGAVRVRCSRCRGIFVVRRRHPEAVGPPLAGRSVALALEEDLEPLLLLEGGFDFSSEELDLLAPDVLPFDFDLPIRFPRPITAAVPDQSSRPATDRSEPLEAAGPVPPNEDLPSAAGNVCLEEPLPQSEGRSGPQGHTQILSEPVRSGQRVDAGAADLVVLGAVSSGAEVVADGHIHVYGVLRGKAVAGAGGDGGARIFCLGLDAELVSVAGRSRVLEELSDELRGKPAQIYVMGEELVIEPIGAAHSMSSRSSGPALEAGRPRPAASGLGAERTAGARALSGLRVAVAVR